MGSQLFIAVAFVMGLYTLYQWSRKTPSPNRLVTDIAVTTDKSPAESATKPIIQVAQNKIWSSQASLFIHKDFDKKGICVVASVGSTDGINSSIVNKESFYYNDRQFFFDVPATRQKTQQKAFQNSATLLDKMITFNQEGALVMKRATQGFLYNRRHRDEIFVPITLGQIGLYMYPWIAENPSLFKFKGVDKFYTSGCLFGSFLRGVTNKASNIPLVDHHIKLNAGEKIIDLYHPSHIHNPYEIMLFSELEKMAKLINFLNPGNPEKTLYFHLPALDYMLFGLELFIKGMLDFDPLKQFIELILIKKEHYEREIASHLSKENINVIFYSPFDPIIPQGTPPKAWLQSLMDLFKIDIHHPQKIDENDIVVTSLKALAPTLDALDALTPLQRVWHDFMSLQGEAPLNFDSLFKLANAIAIGFVSQGHQNYEVGTILLLSEKQIQVKYMAITKSQHEWNYPHVVNLTLFEPIVAYSSKAKGSLFYFSEGKELPKVASLLAYDKILERNKKNIYAFFNQEKLDTPPPSPPMEALPQNSELKELAWQPIKI